MKKFALLFSALFLSSAVHAASGTYSMIKGARTSLAIKTFASPATPTVTGDIPLAEFNSWGALPVLEEKDAYIRFRTPAGKEVWILSEKVELARSIECGRPSPETVIKTVKDESLAARGIGEACGNKGK